MSQKKTIEQLKKLTIDESDFFVSFNYFLDIAENPCLQQLNEVFNEGNDFYRGLLTPVLDSRYNGLVKITSLRLMKIKESNFIHGSAELSNGSILVFYFFEDIHMGMAAVPGFTGNSECFRLTATHNKTSKKKIAPPMTNKTRH